MSKNILGNNALAGYEALFSRTVDASTAEPINANGVCIVEIPLEELHPPEFHPFHVVADEAMTRLAENIKRYGVREPGLARPRTDGGYELLCGNRRRMACEIAGIPTLPVIIRELDNDNATIAMVDSNLEQREKLLHSEKAWAYRVKMEALNHSGVKGDMHSVEVLVAQTGESKNQIFRLIRLTELICTLLDKVDARQLAFNPAVELSYLSQAEQTAVAAAMETHAIKPSLSQAVKLKKLKQSGELTAELIDTTLSEVKKPVSDEPKDPEPYRQFFPPEYTAAQIEDVITSLLKGWQSGQYHTKAILAAV
jgi:ParB family chromosome partitioning protein